MSNVDPYMLDPNDVKKFQEETKGKGSGILCPKKNRSINQPCAVCTQVAVLFNSGKKDDKEVAFMKMAKPNFYFLVVTSQAPDKPFLLEVGKKAGNAILDGASQKGWVDITHPMAGKGREMMISKSKGNAGFPEYSPSPKLEKADWAVADSVIQNLYNLETDLIDILRDGTVPVKKISDLTKEVDTFTFRICPPWPNQTDNKRRFAGVIWRHYGGVTQDEVDGKTKVDLSTTGGKVADKEESQDTVPWDEPAAQTAAQHDKCYGRKEFFDADDATCKSCKDYSPCGKLAMKK